VSSLRLLALIAGPPLLIALSYWCSMSASARGTSTQSFETTKISEFSQTDSNLPPTTSLLVKCQLKADRLWKQLPDFCQVILHEPFIIAGDYSRSELESHYQNSVLPTYRALSKSYFDKSPDEPIVILMFSNDKTYRKMSQKLDGRHTANYYGYYEKSKRRVVLNLSTGNGTLAHELTHALTHFDFPNMPEWFDEGLASLHEHAQLSDDGNKLEGVVNWRLNHLLQGLQTRHLRSLQVMISEATIRPNQQAIDYAQARYFCMYLQNKGLLSEFYHQFRDRFEADRTGQTDLLEITGNETVAEVEQDFLNWIQQSYAPR